MAETHAAALVERYLELGGKRRAAMDDNRVSTRLWDEEPAEAGAFWQQEVASLNEDRRSEVESLLPSINSEANRQA